jgi:hypothetical protein
MKRAALIVAALALAVIAALAWWARDGLRPTD